MSERRSVHRHLAVERPTVWPRRRVGATLALASLLAGLSLSGIACSHPASVAGIAADGVIPKSASLDPGQRLRFQSSLVPVVSWEVVEGYEHGVVTAKGEYQAPYFAPGSPSATVRAKSATGHAEALVTLLDGPADLDACRGPTQDHTPAFGEYVFVDKLPGALYRRLPEYPQPAREAGVQGTVMVMALVCSSGQVIETKVVLSIPMLDDAAQAAVRHWVFEPAKAGGEPVAVWVGVPVRFSLH
ncbi:MAG TPA: energy transducer TonB [Candidatus Eisenbacteria bacterium]|jgi:protein TonB